MQGIWALGVRNMWARLKGDTALAVITTVGICSLVGITPFLIYRVLQGHWFVVVVDLVLLLTTLVSVAFSWGYRSSTLAHQLLALTYAVGNVVVAIQLRPYGILWFYCLILFNFFVLPPRQSSVLTLSVLIVLCGYGFTYPGTIFTSTQHLLAFAGTSLISSTFAYIFSWRTAQQNIRLQELANIDPLTGVGNRRTMAKELDIAVSNYQRHGDPFGLLLLDLDNFKQINDRHGHAEGDRVLVEFSALVLKKSRRTDRLFRLGGEEFVLLLPAVGYPGLAASANNILHYIADNLRSEGKPGTVSIGGAMLGQGDDIDSWLHKADICMYQAKQQGRNQRVIHAQASPATFAEPQLTSM